ncbi:MAG: formate C-acetyltransferase [Clostridia bacterium]|nr:formate C-acetyltransferase [Clostridia bacterium]MBQ2940944.1 formate C-acetyltransferase [Clostridia bacterium]
MNFEAWNGFRSGRWMESVDVKDFIQKNYTPYEGNEDFLAPPTEKTKKLYAKFKELLLQEMKQGVLDVETYRVSGIDNFEPGYLDKENEEIVGLQTDAPFKRMINPYGGMRMVEQSLSAYGYEMDEARKIHFKEFRKTHNDGVFDAYTPAMRRARSVGLMTGLPDAYGRGRIIGDYRRIALYGIDFLVQQKEADFEKYASLPASEDVIRMREELRMQIRALGQMKNMALRYGVDISQPATNAKEAIQFTYFGYLAAIKENNGAAMSFGRNSTFFDIYITRDMKNGILDEAGAQELIDHLVLKLRMVRHLRTPEYNELFSGDPTWVTESIGGMGEDGRTQVTKSSFRFLHTLTNLDPAPEPNMTVLWSVQLPDAFKKYCAKMSIATDSLQYESDDEMRPLYGDDYAIACCVSSMELGKRMQFFGARVNLAKTLLMSLNDGYDEKKGIKVLENTEPMPDGVLDYDKVKAAFDRCIEEVAALYVSTMNTIHYMHDKYAYEAGQMALHDTEVKRFMAFGIAGLSVVADSLSAIKYAKVTPIRNEEGITVDFEVEGDFPKYGNDDDRVDKLAVEVVQKFSSELKKHATYRDAEHTLSVLTITSNVVYGKKTGTTPDGRKVGEPLAPGANPMHGRDASGALASLNSVAKIPYAGCCQDGISNTFSITPDALGKERETRVSNLVALLDGYFKQKAFHLNVNVLSRETLVDAMEHPEKYPTLTIRISGYAVHFNRLTKEQQLEVISRTMHESI